MQRFEMKQVRRGGITPVEVYTLQDARLLLSRLIYALQAGKITGQKAKDLTYLLINYVSIVREAETIERIKKLEQIAGLK